MKRGSTLFFVLALLVGINAARAETNSRAVHDSVLIIVSAPEKSSPVRERFIAEVIKNRLRNFGIRGETADANRGRFKEGQSKLTLSIKSSFNPALPEYLLACSLTFTDRSSHNIWQRTQNIYGDRVQSLEDSLVEYLQKELRGFPGVYRMRSH